MGQVERELAPHDGNLHVARPEEQLARVERPARSVADLPVSLDDGLSRGKLPLHVIVDAVQNFGKEGLIGLAEGQGVTVLNEVIDEVLGKVRSADDPQLAEKRQPAAVQPDHHLGPRPCSGAACCIGLLGFPV